MYVWNVHKTWIACQSYFIILTVRTRDIPNHDRLSPVCCSLRLTPIIIIVLRYVNVSVISQIIKCENSVFKLFVNFSCFKSYWSHGIHTCVYDIIIMSLYYYCLKVFMRDSQRFSLQSRLQDEVLSRILKIQQWIRAKLVRCRYLQILKSAMTIQVNCMLQYV